MREKNYNSKYGVIAAGAHPTSELLLASFIWVLLESLMQAPWVKLKKLFLSGTYDNFVRQIDAVVRK
jgi:hypothetical protein